MVAVRTVFRRRGKRYIVASMESDSKLKIIYGLQTERDEEVTGSQIKNVCQEVNSFATKQGISKYQTVVVTTETERPNQSVWNYWKERRATLRLPRPLLSLIKGFLPHYL